MNLKTDSYKTSKTAIFSFFVVILSAVVILAPHATSAMLFLEVLQQYKMQITFVAMLWLIFFVVRRHYYCAFVQAGLVIWSIAIISSAYEWRMNDSPCQNSSSLRMMTFNSYHLNSDYAAIIDSVTQADPDVVLFQEFKSGLYHVTQKFLKPHYPFYYAEIEHGVFQGKALYSKHPIAQVENIDLRGAYQKIIHATIDIEGQDVDFINLHTVSPQSNERIRLRNTEMKLLPALVNRLMQAGNPTIVAGDFNSVPWQTDVLAFKKQTGLNNNGLKNIILSWPSWLPAVLQVPIDQIFYSREFNKSKYYKGLSAGSDHFPVFIDLNICK